MSANVLTIENATLEVGGVVAVENLNLMSGLEETAGLGLKASYF